MVAHLLQRFLHPFAANMWLSHINILLPIFCAAFLILQQSILAAGESNNLGACENRYFNTCSGDFSGVFCQWDDCNNRCVSGIRLIHYAGSEVMPPATESFYNDCLSEPVIISTPLRSMSANESESAPTAAPSTYEKCKHLKRSLDYFLCLGFTDFDVKLNIIVSKFTASMSILGSSYIIQDVLRDPNKRQKSTFHRIMVGLSSSDIIYSFFGFFLGTWTMPKGENILAIGSVASCHITGFLYVMTLICTPLYNCSLATYFILQINLNWGNKRIQAAGKWLHIFPWTIGLALSLYATVIRAYGPLGYICGFNDSEKAVYIFSSFMALPFLYVTISMFFVYKNVRGIEKKAELYTFANYRPNAKTARRSHRVMVQGILYSVALFTLYAVPMVSGILAPRLSTKGYKVIELLLVITVPSQGFFNVLIYVTPKVRHEMMKRRKARNRKTQKLKLVEEETKEEIKKEYSIGKISSIPHLHIDEESQRVHIEEESQRSVFMSQLSESNDRQSLFRGFQQDNISPATGLSHIIEADAEFEGDDYLELIKD